MQYDLSGLRTNTYITFVCKINILKNLMYEKENLRNDYLSSQFQSITQLYTKLKMFTHQWKWFMKKIK